MGFFDRFYYGKAGKHDYTEMDLPKNRISLFFMVLKDHLFDLVKMNGLQLVCWIPFLFWTFLNAAAQLLDMQSLAAQESVDPQILSSMTGYLLMWLLGLIPCIAVTGPSSAGSAYVMRNWARDQHAFLFSDFKDAWKENWKQALGVSCITAVVPVLAFTGVMYYGQMAAANVVLMVPLVLVISLALLWTLMLPLLYPMMIGYRLSFKHLLKNALLMSVASLPKMLLTRLITFLPVAVLLLGVLMGSGWVILGVALYYLFFGFALSRLIYASVANGVFDKYLNPHIEGAPVNLGLRPKEEDEDDEGDEEE